MSKFDAKAITKRLKAIHEADPVADLAKELIDAGVTEEQLHKIVYGPAWDNYVVPNHLTLELYNKVRDIEQRGCTVNRNGITKRFPNVKGN